MKKIKYSLLVLSLIALVGCGQATPNNPGGDNNNSGDNNNGGNDNTGDNNNGGNDNNGGEEKPEEKHTGLTPESAFTAKEVNEICKGLENKVATDQKYYVFGTVTKVEEISTKFGNGTFDIESGGESIVVFRIKDLNNVKFTDSTAVKVGDKIIAYAALVNYDGKYETNNGYLYSINDKTSSSGDSGTTTNPGGGDHGGSDSGNNGGSTSTPSTNTAYTGHYYDSINASTLTGGKEGTLRTALTSLVQPKDRYTYSGSQGGHLGKELCDINEDPNNPENMILFYTKKSIKKELSSAGNWNREHTWPQSLSGGLYGTSGGGADALHIMPTYNQTNSKRGNKKFGNVSGNTWEVFAGEKYCKTTSTMFEPIDARKGDCARIVFYMWTTYFATRGTPITNVAESVETLKAWHKLDPVDDTEMLRNNRVEASVQKNRNPFVDHPEWVDLIF